MLTKTEVASTRAKLMDEYNEIMAQYISDNNIDDIKAEKIHDDNVVRSKIMISKKMLLISNDEKHIRKLLEMRKDLKNDDDKDILRYCSFLLYIIGEIDTIIDRTDTEVIENAIGIVLA